MSGELRPGDKLPPERELAEQIGVGRPVVREAFRSLEAAGILEFKAGVRGGAFVKSADAAAMVQSMNDMIFLGGVTLKEITEARLTILGHAIELAAKRGTKKQFDDIDANISYTETLLDKKNDPISLAAIMDFYGLLGAASHNNVLATLNEALSNIIVQILLKAQPDFVKKDFIAARRAIAAQLRSRNAAGARAALEKHLLILHRLVEASSKDLYGLNLKSL